MTQATAERASRGADAASKLARLKAIIREKSLITGREMTLVSGRTSSHYFDMKPTTFDPEGASLIGELIVERLAENPPQFVAGLEMGALPVVMSVVIQSRSAPPEIGGFCVRKASKDHGTRRLVERELAAGCSVVAVDDVTTTAGSVIKAACAIREAGGKVDHVITIVDRQEGARENLAKEGIALTALLEAGEFDLTAQ